MSVYLDHNATSPTKPAVIDAVAAAMRAHGNASSVHASGRDARGVVEDARKKIAQVFGVESKQVIFTSGATEANNTIIKSYAGRILTSGIEHPSVVEAVKAERIPVHADGIVDVVALEKMMTDTSSGGAALVSVMWVNNETGVIQPVEKISALCQQHGVKFHCDAVQAMGRIPVSLVADYVTVSAHKIAGPMGVGAIIVAPKAPPVKLIHGGGQERRQRAGTENVAGIAGFGVAAALCDVNAFQKLSALRDKIENEIPGITVFGQNSPRVANTTCFALPGVVADTQLMALDLAGFCVSSGSACSSGSVKPSHVLEAMGIDPAIANCALRVSLGWNTSTDDVDSFIATYKKLSANWLGKEWQK